MSEKARRIMLGFRSPVDGRLMREWVTGLDYEVVESFDETGGIDLVLLDSASARRLMDQAFGLKREAKYFLPVLVGIDAGDDAGDNVGRWLNAGFDDVLRLPATKDEWRARIDIMLRLRRQSEELGQKSEASLRYALETMSDGFVSLDENWHYTLVNKNAGELLGRKPEDLIGKHIWTEFPEGIGQPFYKNYYKAVETQKAICFEDYYPPWDRWFENRVIPSKMGLSIFFQDITERKQAEEARRESEEIFRKAFRTSPDSININRLDDGMYISINDGFTKITGYSESDIIGKTSLEMNIWVNPGDRETLVEGLRQHGQVKNFEAQFRMKDGKVVNGLMSATVITLHGVPHIISITRDITERKQAQQALQKSEAKFRSYIENASDGIFVANEKGKYIEVNKAACEITGYPEDELLELTIPELTQEEYSEQAKDNFQTVVKEGFSSAEGGFVTKSGEKRFWSVDAVKLSETRFLGFAKDITERKQAQQALARAVQEWEEIFQAIGHPTLILSPRHAVLAANQAALKVTGMTAEQLAGKPCYEVFHGTSQSPDGCPMEMLMRSGHQGTVEMEMEALGGTFLVSCTPVFDARGELEKVIHIATDVTDRIQAEEARRVLETAIDNAIECIMVSDRENRLTYVNRAFEKLTGYCAAEVLGNTLGMLNSDQHDRAFYQNLKKTIYAGHPWQGNLTLKKNNGELYEAYVTIAPICDHAGIPEHFVSIHRDVTRERELEKRIQQKQWLEAFGTLAGGIAHDFNNLLSPILGYTQLCIDVLPSGSPVREDLEEVMLAATRASELVRQILTFSRRSNHERKPLQMAPILKEALKLLRASIPVTIDIRQKITDTAESVIADPTEIHQVVMNLCTNAFHAMPEGGVLTVSLKTVELDPIACAVIPDCTPGRYLNLSVEDTGQGIASEIRDKIFKPYFTTKEEGRGTGLGLAVTHSIVAACGGAITVHSEPGKGTRFSLYFPVADDAPTEVVEKATSTRSGQERVLVIDDDAAIVALGKRTLERYGYSVTTSTDPVQALEQFKKAPADFDMVITDMTMPGMTGDLLTDALLKIRPDLPIIVCTGFSERMDKEKAQKMGIRRLLDKPFAPGTLLATIREIFDRGPTPS